MLVVDVGHHPFSFALTWIYNNTARSITAVTLFHAMVNFNGEIIAIIERADANAIQRIARG